MRKNVLILRNTTKRQILAYGPHWPRVHMSMVHNFFLKFVHHVMPSEAVKESVHGSTWKPTLQLPNNCAIIGTNVIRQRTGAHGNRVPPTMTSDQKIGGYLHTPSKKY